MSKKLENISKMIKVSYAASLNIKNSRKTPGKTKNYVTSYSQHRPSKLKCDNNFEQKIKCEKSKSILTRCWNILL